MNNRPSPKLRRRLRKASDKMHEKEKAFMRSYNYETLVVLVFAVLFALSLRMFVFQITRVEGPSMEPTFFTDEQVYVDKVEFWFRPPQRGQVIICRYSDDGEAVIKRVIGLPGRGGGDHRGRHLYRRGEAGRVRLLERRDLLRPGAYAGAGGYRFCGGGQPQRLQGQPPDRPRCPTTASLAGCALCSSRWKISGGSPSSGGRAGKTMPGFSHRAGSREILRRNV